MTDIKFNTHDVGILIRDRLEGDGITHLQFDDDGAYPDGDAQVVLIDVSDPSNPMILLDNGQRFLIRIFAI